MNPNQHLMAIAERELGAYLAAVSDLFGAEHAQQSAEDWLDEFERTDALPETLIGFEAITIAAAIRLAIRLHPRGAHSVRHALNLAADATNETENAD